jgi:hypothetical protein
MLDLLSHIGYSSKRVPWFCNFGRASLALAGIVETELVSSSSSWMVWEKYPNFNAYCITAVFTLPAETSCRELYLNHY